MPVPAAKRAIRAEASGASEVTISGRSPAIRAEPIGEPLGVLLVGGDHEPAGLGVRAGAQVDQLAVGVAQHVGDPVALGVERGAQPAGGLGGGQRRP